MSDISVSSFCVCCELFSSLVYSIQPKIVKVTKKQQGEDEDEKELMFFTTSFATECLLHIGWATNLEHFVDLFCFFSQKKNRKEAVGFLHWFAL